VIAISVGFVAATMVLSAVFEQLSERERDRRSKVPSPLRGEG
jgi:hypothetical protein